jgi:hypothetical protein
MLVLKKWLVNVVLNLYNFQELLYTVTTYIGSDNTADRRPTDNPRKQILFMKGLDNSNMKPSESSAPTKQESSAPIRMSSLREVVELLLRTESASFVVVDELDTFDNFIMKLLNQPLGTKVTLII